MKGIKDENRFDLLRYDEDITCFANSIMKSFGVDIQGELTLKYMDPCLEKTYKMSSYF